MSISDKDIHKGHRDRMRQKFAVHGARAFDTYELLEMLLYYVIPYKDTNPVSKKLLAEFGDLDGVFSAGRDELVRVSGVGAAAADFLLAVGKLINATKEDYSTSVEAICFDDYAKAGTFVVDYFSSLPKGNPRVAMMLLDGRMNLIGIRVLYELDYESGAVRADAFLDYALTNRASVAIVAHTHPRGPLFPTVGDMATNAMLSNALALAGVKLAEHYVVCGDSYVGTMSHLKFTFGQSAELDRFIKSKGGASRE